MKNNYTSSTPDSYYYTIYQITNLVNNKIYVGCHKTNDINDEYMGSGKYLIAAQQKYGMENFKKEILYIFDNSDDMFSKEKEIVNESFVNRKDTYNLKIGGEGGWSHINSHMTAERLEKMKNNMKKIAKKNKDTVAVVDENGNKFRVDKDDLRLQTGELVGHTKGCMASYDKDGNFFYVKKDDPRVLSGELVSNNKGKYYITNGEKRKLISIQDEIPDGWYIGDNREKYNKGKVWVKNSNGESKMIYPEDIEDGWEYGRHINKK